MKGQSRPWIRAALMLVGVVLTAVVLAACGSDSDSGGSTSTGGSSGGKDLSVAMVFDQEPGDDATIDGMLVGMKKAAKDFGYSKTKTISVLDASQRESTVRSLAEAGYPLIIGAVQGMAPAFKAVAPDFPKTKFALFFAEVKEPNVGSYFAPQQEMGYPAGLAAGLVTKTNKLGYVDGIEYPLIRDAEAGFIAGALAVNPNVKVYDKVPNTLTDPGVGKEVAQTMVGQGVDTIGSLSVHTSLGIYQYLGQLKKQGKEVWAASNDAQHIGRYAGSAGLISSVFLMQNAVYDIMEQFKDGTLEGGLHQMTLKNKQLGVSSWGPDVPPEVIKKVEALSAKQAASGKPLPDHTDIAKYKQQGILIAG